MTFLNFFFQYLFIKYQKKQLKKVLLNKYFIKINKTFFKMKNQEKPASFINKLYNILKSKQHCKAIIWDTQLKGIKVLNQKKLEETVLPRYYRHNRFASFVRQLNMYDFHKIHLGDHKSIFCHETFDPKNKETIYIVKRKVTFNLQNTDKNSSTEEKEQISEIKNQPKQIRSLRSLKSIIPSQKQNFWSFGSSFKLVKNSIKMIHDRGSQRMDLANQITDQQALQELLQQILPLNLNPDQTRIKIRKLKKKSLYKKFLLKKQFKQTLFQRLGIQYDTNNDNLSQLSIEGQLLIQTKKSLPQRSLKYVESGPINYRDTIRCLMNL